MKFLTKEWCKKCLLSEIGNYEWLGKNNIAPTCLFLVNFDRGGIDSEMFVDTFQPIENLTETEQRLNCLIIPSHIVFNPENDYDKDSLFTFERSLKDDFLTQYMSRLQATSFLPEKILSKIPDKRLFAMGYAEPKLRKIAIEYGEKMRAEAIAATDEASKIIEPILKELKEMQNIDLAFIFRDGFVCAEKQRGVNLELELDSHCLILEDTEVIEREIEIKNNKIYAYEIYKTESGYELHFLLEVCNKNNYVTYHYATYRFKDIKATEKSF